ncbi:hypothetical protein NP233_g5196 [Leucocoprinus birnbaumii]|uniref:Uncharacterized protein n=1 Tax=Leucocoprinus birnbaumii TaxID=56174 RepID=A0AAD5VTR4_9AGAR|nr:hypothetical protein NP233_g5196 [Leucocoprinus birnbaumii]
MAATPSSIDPVILSSWKPEFVYSGQSKGQENNSSPIHFYNSIWIDRTKPRLFRKATTWILEGVSYSCISQAERCYWGESGSWSWQSQCLAIFSSYVDGPQIAYTLTSDQYYIAISGEGLDLKKQSPRLNIVDYSKVREALNGACITVKSIPRVLYMIQGSMQRTSAEFVNSDIFVLSASDHIWVFEIIPSSDTSGHEDLTINQLYEVDVKAPTLPKIPSDKFYVASRTSCYDLLGQSFSTFYTSSSKTRPPIILNSQDPKVLSVFNRSLMRPTEKLLTYNGVSWSISCILNQNTKEINPDSFELMQHQWDHATSQLKTGHRVLPALPSMDTAYQKLIGFDEEIGRFVLWRSHSTQGGVVFTVVDLM